VSLVLASVDEFLEGLDALGWSVEGLFGVSIRF
jgi:hypothetical protein